MEEALLPLQRTYGAQGNEVMTAWVGRTRQYTAEVVEELKKVTWPDWPQLKSATFVIIIFVLIVSLIIWIMDLTVRGVLGLIMDMFA